MVVVVPVALGVDVAEKQAKIEDDADEGGAAMPPYILRFLFILLKS
jgi:hypothetical protein